MNKSETPDFDPELDELFDKAAHDVAAWNAITPIQKLVEGAQGAVGAGRMGKQHAKIIGKVADLVQQHNDSRNKR